MRGLAQPRGFAGRPARRAGEKVLTRWRLFAVLCAIAPVPAFAQTTHQIDAETRLETWEAHATGVSVRLTQISPDQATAFFLGRGFPPDAARHYAGACVFMTVVRNSGPEAIEYDLRAWRVIPERGAPQPMRVKEDWFAEWARRGLSENARIGFDWSQFPTKQAFEPGDWNQGMTTYALPHGARFDLQFTWRTGAKTMSATLEGARCARSDAVR